jgi:hypothetical protein
MKKTPEVTVETAFKPSIIHIETTKDDKVVYQTSNVNFEILLRMMIPAIVNSAKQIYQTAAEQKLENIPALTPAQLEDLKLTMYDTMNIAFSNALDQFAPEIEARPNLSADAILKAQNELLEEEMKAANYHPTKEEVEDDFEEIKAEAVKEDARKLF